MLTICIPTYNRKDKLKSQLNFFISELASSELEIKILVRDNASDNYALSELEIEYSKYSFIVFIRNSHNVGLVGNLKLITSDVITEYVWFVGDDDKLKKGIVEAVYSKLKYNKGLVFINHRAIDLNGNVIKDCAFKGHHSLYKVFDYSGTTMMFITACVYKTKYVREIFEKQEVRLSLPFYMSFYSYESSGVAYIDEVYIDNVWGDVSWSDSLLDVFGKQVPLDLMKLIKISKERNKLMCSLVKYSMAKWKLIVRAFLMRYKK